ncbi:rhodanese-like domain-containing protein [Maribacter sp. ANRC-HE7]|uniref:Rhodanese-like domain-containing protein n=1 Tax=Maribacter aquimaris TaxID=2737171 RepID=A0ABR7UWH5_9FLAO|nr:rhodanese-like domain-containing protein [Maribacter aquimaris]MBD0776320.1 rhodanese-like domain-containing protein [Maribacter aquimaris]
MKELEKTKHISISTVVFILVILIGILTFKKPTNVYKKTNRETLAMVNTQDYLVDYSNVDPSNSVFIDIRDRFEYSKGHIDNALNMPTADILEAESIARFDDLTNKGKTVVFYGKNQNEANSAWMILYQLGYDNIKILNSTTQLVDNRFLVTDFDLEKPVPNYLDIFKGNTENSGGEQTMAPVTPKKVIAVKKKKKRKPEGGC